MTIMAETALITGASGGIGLELAKVFASKGHPLVLVARSEALRSTAAELAATHKVRCEVILQDLTEPGAAQATFEEAARLGVQVDILVNNAGFTTYGYFTDLDLQKELNLIQLNIAALVHLSGLFLPGMKARRAGRILNIASTAAFVPGPLMATYYASKAFVLSWTEALATEMRGSGVTLTCLCPGPTATGFQTRAAMTDSKLVQNRDGLMTAEAVALAGYEGTMRGTDIVIPGGRNRITAFATRLFPRAQLARTVMNAQEKTGH